jgi:two-component system KDP operon response regulator KdpE
MTRVLVVDDEPLTVRTLGLNLRARRYEVSVARDGGEALRRAADWHPDVTVLDLGLPDIDGVEVIHGLRGWKPCHPHYLLTEPGMGYRFQP